MGSLSEIEYGGNAFRVSRGNGEGRICLDDVCAAIHRGEMLKLRTIGELCPTLASGPDGTTWASFGDAVNMLEYARKSIWGRQRIAYVLAFVRALIEEQNESAREETATEQKPDDISFEYEGTRFRARRRGGRMMFNATEMSKIHRQGPFRVVEAEHDAAPVRLRCG